MAVVVGGGCSGSGVGGGDGAGNSGFVGGVVDCWLLLYLKVGFDISTS